MAFNARLHLIHREFPLVEPGRKDFVSRSTLLEDSESIPLQCSAYAPGGKSGSD